ncbi:MAG TPA: 50S ribosomal protein L11 methyltransferase [Vicinamibacterales bacterium]|nr:50S ribosomal protein L11 methyltransferase [Vicinamibacterales bacterium]
MSLELDEHRQYLADTVRLDAFARALTATVRPGDVVLDLASGTGILGFLACQAGAARVYAVDQGPIIGLARQLAQVNGLSDRITFLRNHSEWVTLPEPVDVVVTDQIGRIGFDAGLFEYLIDARDRLAKPGARLIPRRLDLWFVPCEHEELRSVVEFWQAPVARLSLDPAHAIARATGYPRTIEHRHQLSAPQRLTSSDLTQPCPLFIEGRGEFVVSRDGCIDAIAGWFRAELAADVWMTNGPEHPRIDRRHAMLAVNPGIAVSAGDVIAVTVSFRPTTTLITWALEVRSASGEVRSHMRRSTFEGMLISSEDLSRTAPDRIPRLGRPGQIRAQVLALCDGVRPLGQIEALVYQRNLDFFNSPSSAARFVSEVLLRYGE